MALEGQPRPDDLILDAGLIKLILDPYSLDILDGSVIDYVETVSGGGFTLTAANRGCGCGHGHDSDGGCSCGHGEEDDEESGHNGGCSCSR